MFFNDSILVKFVLAKKGSYSLTRYLIASSSGQFSGLHFSFWSLRISFLVKSSTPGEFFLHLIGPQVFHLSELCLLPFEREYCFLWSFDDYGHFSE